MRRAVAGSAEAPARDGEASRTSNCLAATVLGALFLQPPILPSPLSRGIWVSLLFAAVPVPGTSPIP